MNVLFVDQYSEMGGAQHCLLDLVPGIRQRGWNCVAALPGDGPLIAKLSAGGVPVEHIPWGPYSWKRKRAADTFRFLLDTARAAAIIKRITAERNIDLVYANGPRVLPAASLCSAPLLYHAHSVPSRGRDLWLIRRCARRATVVAVSRFVAESLGSGCSSDVVPNGTEDLGFRPWSQRDQLRVGVIGRIAPEKGQLEFVEAARILSQQNISCRFVICGGAVLADPAYAEEVRHRATGLPIEFAGWLETPREAMQTVDVLVVPSGPNEGFSRVVLEAFSAGVPVVASASGGIPELISDGQTGFLVTAHSAAALAARVREALEAPARLAAMAVAARGVWERHYKVERYRDQVLALIADAVLRNRNQKSRPAATAAAPADKSMAG